MDTPATHRRRAAFAALQPLVGEARSRRALASLHQQLRSDGIADVIAFVDALARQEQLDDATRRSLYASLHAALRSPADDLPADPLPALDAAPGPAGPAPSSRPAPAPARVLQPEQAAQAVFAQLIGAVMRSIRRRHASLWEPLHRVGLAQFERAHVTPFVRETACAAWQHDGSDTWQVPGRRDELIELLRRLYLALAEVLGPHEADALVTEAARAAAQIPEARLCPPGRLL